MDYGSGTRWRHRKGQDNPKIHHHRLLPVHRFCFGEEVCNYLYASLPCCCDHTVALKHSGLPLSQLKNHTWDSLSCSYTTVPSLKIEGSRYSKESYLLTAVFFPVGAFVSFVFASRQVVPCPTDPHRVAIDPGLIKRAQSRRPPGQRRGGAVEVKRSPGHRHRYVQSALASAVRHVALNLCHPNANFPIPSA